MSFALNCKNSDKSLKWLNYYNVIKKNNIARERETTFPVIVIQPLNLYSLTLSVTTKCRYWPALLAQCKRPWTFRINSTVSLSDAAPDTQLTRQLHIVAALFRFSFQIPFCFFVCFVLTAASTDPTHLFLLLPSANDCFFSFSLPLSPPHHKLCCVVWFFRGWAGLCLSLDHSVWL